MGGGSIFHSKLFTQISHILGRTSCTIQQRLLSYTYTKHFMSSTTIHTIDQIMIKGVYLNEDQAMQTRGNGGTALLVFNVGIRYR